MLKITQYDEVTRYDSAHTIAGRGRYWTTAYLVDGLLVDSGCAHTAQELAARLEGKKLTTIVNTHTHEDHIGANGVLQEKRKGLRVCAHPLALPILEDPRARQPLHPYRRLLWGFPLPCRGVPLQDGDLIETEQHRFQVLFTPGHSADHICLYEPENAWLFTGDLFVGGRERALIANADIWQVIASLKRIRELPLQRLFPGCARVREDPLEEITKKIEYLEEMSEKVLDCHSKGMNLHAITRRLFGNPMPIEVITGGHFSRRNLVLSYLAQVDR